MMLSRWWVVGCLSAMTLVGCGDDDSQSSEVNDAENNAPNNTENNAPNNTENNAPNNTENNTPEPSGITARCNYVNPFSQGNECKAYTGLGWTLETAEADCGQVIGNTAGTFAAGEACDFEDVLGFCEVGDQAADGYTLESEGSDPGSCAATQVGCETFTGGTFTPGPVCDEQEPPDTIPSGVFIPPFESCQEPLDGEEQGLADGGQVCTKQAIQGCTEPGRFYPDYADCRVPISQRPYFSFLIEPGTSEDDPRLSDDAYMAELAWVTEQVEACACTCCHTESATPSGASSWDTETGPIWIDSISEEGLAMMAGLADSSSFGAYPPEDNNGFDRSVTGTPTTDIERMQAFFVNELLRRDVDVENTDYRPFGGPIYDQLIYEPGPCENGEGVDAEGRVNWDGLDARYVYVLEGDADNPGVPPNLDLPQGTLWRLDVAPDSQSVGSGIAYGEIPEGASQVVPESGEAPALVSGQDYYIYVLFDIGIPLARCIFTYEQ